MFVLKLLRVISNSLYGPVEGQLFVLWNSICHLLLLQSKSGFKMGNIKWRIICWSEKWRARGD